MTNCKFCGKEEIQNYTFDDIFTCNECMDNPDNFMNIDDNVNDIIFIDSNGKRIIIDNDKSMDITSDDVIIQQMLFLQKQLNEKDSIIKELLSVLRNNQTYHNDSSTPLAPDATMNNRTFTFLNSYQNIKNSTPAPIEDILFSTPDLSSSTTSSFSTHYTITDEYVVNESYIDINSHFFKKKQN